MMDCDTTGIEPDIALVKYKKLVGEGFLKIVNQTVPGALRKLGYTPEQVDSIVAYVNERETIEGAPELKPEHLSVFDCAFKPMNGTRSIHYMGHLRMMSAVQPFLSGAISKTVNMPETATPAEIETVYLEGWRMGLKAIAIYRDNSKRTQPLNTGKKKDTAEARGCARCRRRRRRPRRAEAVPAPPAGRANRDHAQVRHLRPRGLHHRRPLPDGQPGEIFLKMAKEGSTISGLMDTFATTVSVALQYGVPLHDLVHKFAHVRFEPSGFTSNPEIPIAKSIIDYIFRWLGSRFLPPEDRATLGLVDRSSAGEIFGPAAQPRTRWAPGAGSAGTSGSGSPPAARPASPPSGARPAKLGTSTAAWQPPDRRRRPRRPPERAPTLHRQLPSSGNGHGQLPLANGNGTRQAPRHARQPRHRQGPGHLHLPGRRPQLRRMRLDHGPQRQSCYKCLNCGSTSGCS